MPSTDSDPTPPPDFWAGLLPDPVSRVVAIVLAILVALFCILRFLGFRLPLSCPTSFSLPPSTSTVLPPSDYTSFAVAAARYFLASHYAPVTSVTSPPSASAIRPSSLHERSYARPRCRPWNGTPHPAVHSAV
ncbi:hypothetical protein DFH08DRAFT_951198 [Mycena albidolilacea]|uniref:Uncharacterized protein n=1 Tax=Mycena albidolilacea TaxID=1033008 RepID=A0AAD7F3I7_9AGAR|nr:hypothetical protein DFH08DRAFT_951198 [Mycena albidolilacea]